MDVGAKDLARGLAVLAQERRAGEADEDRSFEPALHLLVHVAALGAVALVHEDIEASRDPGRWPRQVGRLELVDQRADEARRRRAQPALALGNMVHDPRLGPDGHAVADSKMSGESGLARDGHVVSDLGAAGDAHLRHHDAVLADRHVVSDLNEVIHLGSAAEDRGTQRGAVDGHAGADLHIVMQDHLSDLRNLAVLSLVEHIPEAVRTDDRPGVDSDAASEHGAGIDRDVGKQPASLSNDTVVSHRDEGLQDGGDTGRCTITVRCTGRRAGGRLGNCWVILRVGLGIKD